MPGAEARRRPGTGGRARGGAAEPPPAVQSDALPGALAGPHVRRRRVAARGGADSLQSQGVGVP